MVANCLVFTKVDADLVPSAEQSMAQAPSRFAREQGWRDEQHPPKPEYEPFADQVREAVAETLADNARYQEQARRLLEGQGEGDVTPASPAISQPGPGRSFIFLGGQGLRWARV